MLIGQIAMNAISAYLACKPVKQLGKGSIFQAGFTGP
jgi:hypothetical protein